MFLEILSFLAMAFFESFPFVARRVISSTKYALAGGPSRLPFFLIRRRSCLASDEKNGQKDISDQFLVGVEIRLGEAVEFDTA